MGKLVVLPNPILRQVSKSVEPDDDITELIETMTETLYREDGIGLAAVQIGVLKRVILVETSQRATAPRVFVNPEIIHSSIGTEAGREGCLSIPLCFEEIERSSTIVVQYQDVGANQCVEALEGLAARCVQHEVDHLNGVLFIDHLSMLKRTRLLKKAGKAH